MKMSNFKFVFCAYSPGKTGMLKGKKYFVFKKKNKPKPILHYFSKELSLYQRKKRERS